jgi:hypothetical protein
MGNSTSKRKSAPPPSTSAPPTGGSDGASGRENDDEPTFPVQPFSTRSRRCTKTVREVVLIPSIADSALVKEFAVNCKTRPGMEVNELTLWAVSPKVAPVSFANPSRRQELRIVVQLADKSASYGKRLSVAEERELYEPFYEKPIDDMLGEVIELNQSRVYVRIIAMAPIAPVKNVKVKFNLNVTVQARTKTNRFSHLLFRRDKSGVKVAASVPKCWRNALES